MENSNKALIMAASTLLAVMLFAVFTQFLQGISTWPQAQDDILSTEQKAAFNGEYEVYQKSLMYGVDVISCLNKAKSNNEKYEEGGGFLSGDAYGIEYHIDVYVKIKENLEESLTVYYFNEADREVAKFDDGTVGIYMGDIGFVGLPDSPTTNNGKYYTSFSKITKLYTQEGISLPTITMSSSEKQNFLQADGGIFKLNEEEGYYSLEYNTEEQKEKFENQDSTQLKRLISFSSENMTQTVRNMTGNNLRIWSSATWKSALYDFKTKKFTCDAINYNAETGLVNELWFSEK